ncbi:hypothetical protein MIMGU_mgv1a020396mg, partial [Erythranthe guttata]
QQEIRTRRKQPPPLPAFTASLHCVRKFPTKKFITKKLPIAPLPRTPPKLYKVSPADFKDAVQKLTGASSGFTRLQEVAPPPLSVPPPAYFHPASPYWDATANIVAKDEKEEEKNFRKSYENNNNCGSVIISPIDFSLSPSSLAWCWSVLMSPEVV